MPLTGTWLKVSRRHVLRAVQVALVITSVGDCTFGLCVRSQGGSGSGGLGLCAPGWSWEIATCPQSWTLSLNTGNHIPVLASVSLMTLGKGLILWNPSFFVCKKGVTLQSSLGCGEGET